jgi:hypothetical protein
VGGKICRKRQLLPASGGGVSAKNPYFIGFFTMARRLLRNWPRRFALVGVFAMLLALGAASTAIDALLGLTSTKSAQSTGSGQDKANLFAFQADANASSGAAASPAAGGGAHIAPETMNALLAAQSQSSQSFQPMSRSDALKDLFSKIDADGDGKITKDEFEKALGAGGTNRANADQVFGKLDKDGDGSVTMDEMSSALKGGRGHHGHHHMAGGADGAGGDQSSQGAQSSSVTNADGSTTTTLTYADGSKVSMTTPAAASGASSATSSYNFIERLIQREAKQVSAQASSSLSVSV